MTISNDSLLSRALEQLAQFMEEVSTLEYIRHDLNAITLMADVNQAALSEGSNLLDSLELQAPTFCRLFSSVMLRSIREPINYGTDE